ncbi:MAG: AbrB/MazE/SpoVT family DNA-binding domain-containing protein [Acidobacteria bacterium]|nr:AbrB/MazE/SpoVT family DNA-binding domain-containing protein [Acidobacteriota bacterium]
MLVSKISSKGQVTIPKKVRESLRAGPGDLLVYEVQDNRVVLRRVEPFDRAFHAALSDTLTEWSSPEDEDAFRDL